MNSARPAVMLGLATAFAAALLTHEEPLVMLLGLLPVAWILLEGVWRLLDDPRQPRRRPRQAASRTGMRRAPNGLPNF